ncbi:MAG TPA: hypothetical protein VKP66_14460 [Steroidobacteraceae bacterium]|nr:hypothetical protein [Steroidobacteraceae bacterium]
MKRTIRTPGERRIFENQLRRMAETQGYRLIHDPQSVGVGRYTIADRSNNSIVAGARRISIEDVEAFISGKRPQARRST